LAVGKRDEEGKEEEEREKEVAAEILERLIEGAEGWEEIIKSVPGVFRDGIRREVEDVGGCVGSDDEEVGYEEGEEVEDEDEDDGEAVA